MEDYYTIQTTEHCAAMFSSLHTLQKQGVLCDVILAAEDGEVMAHKVLLMAASSYFRQRLSPLVSANASRIYMKGISVVELANLVKYIYTGKLLVAKDTMDVTLEVSEILGLNGIIQGYQDIIEYEQTKMSGDNKSTDEDHLEGHLISGQDVNMLHNTAMVSQKASPVTETKVSQMDQSVFPQTSDDIRVTQYCEDGSTITYAVEKPEGIVMPSHQPSTADYNFDFQPFEQQYMDVSAGTGVHSQVAASTPNTVSQATEDIVIDEQAQHQDLLSVAIMKLSDGSQALAGDGAVSCETSSETVKKSSNKKSDKYVNGKIDTKIVTLSAGKISNNLGGHTSVYTVALDPSTIKEPLKMPRFQRKKTDKERIAEQNAKRYRKKKAELIAVKGNSESTDQPSTDMTSNDVTIIAERDGLDPLQVHTTEEVSTLPASLIQAQASKFQEVLNAPPHKLIYVEPELKNNKDEASTTIKQEVFSCESGDDNIQHSFEEKDGHCREDFGCSVNFDSDGEGKTCVPKVIHPKVYKNKQKEANDVIHVVQNKKVPCNESSTEGSVKVVSPSKTIVEKRHQFMVLPPEKTTKDKSISLSGHVKDKVVEKLPKIISDTEKESDKIDISKDRKQNYIKTDCHSDAFEDSPSKNEEHEPKNPCETVKQTSTIVQDGKVEEVKRNEPRADSLLNQSKDSPDKTNDRSDAMSDELRSSATKRKGKVPRRLPLTLSEKEELNQRNLPNIRTRRSSRNEGNRKRWKSKSKSADHEEIDNWKTSDVDSDIEMIDIAVERDTQSKDEITDPYIGVGDSEAVGDEGDLTTDVLIEKNHEENTDQKVSSKKGMLPGAQLQTRSLRRRESLRKQATSLQKNNDSRSESSLGEIDVEIQTHVPRYDEYVQKKNVHASSDVERIAKGDPEIKGKGVKRRRTVSFGQGSKRAKRKIKTNESNESNKTFQSTSKANQLNQGESESDFSANGRVPTTSGHVSLIKKSPSLQDCYSEMKLEDASSGEIMKAESLSEATGKEEEMTFECLEKGQEPDKETSFICKCCRSNFRTKVAMKGHLNSKLVFGNSKCVYCDTAFKKGSEFFNHLYQEHEVAAHKDFKHFSCKDCRHISFTKKEMTNHLRTHEGTEKKCSKCPKTFDDLKELRLHETVHKEKQVCSVCYFSTYSKASLVTHIKLKHDVNKEEHTCQFCYYKTPLVGNLRKHMQSAHELTVVTKQSKHNRALYKDFEDGTLLTKDGQVFDPETTPLPKISSRMHGTQKVEISNSDQQESNNDDGSESAGGSNSKQQGKRVPLKNLSTEDFHKEIMKRHEDYLKKPEKVHRVMSKSLAVATAHPSFPQASPNVRVNKANKLYNTPKPNHLYTELLGTQALQYLNVETVNPALPSVEQEVEIPGIHEGGQRSEDMVMTLPVGVDGKVLQVMIDQGGQNTLVDTMDVVNALLEAGHQIEVQDEVEIQNN